MDIVSQEKSLGYSGLKTMRAEAVSIITAPKWTSYTSLKRRIAVSLKFPATPRLFSMFRSRGRLTTNFSQIPIFKHKNKPVFTIAEGNNIAIEEVEKPQPVCILRVPYCKVIQREEVKTRKRVELTPKEKKRLKKTTKEVTVTSYKYNKKTVLSLTNNMTFKFTENEKKKKVMKKLDYWIKKYESQRKTIINRYNDVQYAQQKAELNKREQQYKKNVKQLEKDRKWIDTQFDKLEVKRANVKAKIDQQYDILNSKRERLNQNYEKYHQKLDQYYDAVDNLRKKKQQLNPRADGKDSYELYQPPDSNEGNQTNGKLDYGYKSDYTYDDEGSFSEGE
jgi:hypothetical protein